MKPAARKMAGKPAPRKSKNDSQAAKPEMPAQLSQCMPLYDAAGARRYLTAGERDAFLRVAEEVTPEIGNLCMTLANAGYRLSEALEFTVDRVHLAAGTLIFETMRKRRTGVFRAVPMPPTLLKSLDLVHGIRQHQAQEGKGRGELLCLWSRMTAWRFVHPAMERAGLSGAQLSAKWLHHGFGVAAVSAGISLNLVQKWLVTANLTTTAIHANAAGAEEKKIANRMCG